MSKENVIEMKRRKEEIRWEFAWQVFDEVYVQVPVAVTNMSLLEFSIIFRPFRNYP